MKNKNNVLPRLTAMAAILSSTASFAGSWQQDVNIGGFNDVHIYTPDTQSSVGNGKALLIVLHGCVQPIDNYLTANLEAAAENHGMVIAVPDAANKAGYNCWSYWQGAISRSSADYKNLIDLANTMSSDPARGIDANQVYLAGLSSGGAFTQQAGCVAPDVFAGVAPSAGPSLGTSSNGALNNCEVVTATTYKNRCESYAGSYSSFLDTQIAVVGHGTADTTVDTCYNQQNANGYANIYGVSALSGTTSISDDATRTAQETKWQDGRVAMLWFDGLDHSWSGGQGASGDYVAGNSINFADYLGQYFAQNNKRVDRNQVPEVQNLSANDGGGFVAVEGNATDTDGSVSAVEIEIYQVDVSPALLKDYASVTASAADGYFSYNSAPLEGALYEVRVTATDDNLATSVVSSETVRVGPEPPATAPSLSNIVANVSAQCATVTGNVVDVNLNLSQVSVAFNNNSIVAVVNGTQFSAEACGLPGGNNTATVTATDSTQLSSSSSVNFVIDAGQTGDYNFHINEGHITWGSGYSACYLAFGTAQFTMREYPAGTEQCNWVADGEPSCKGPNQACSAPSQPTDSDGDGVADGQDNCPNNANTDQADNDNDGIGNVCDATPDGDPIADQDSDGIADNVDNCPAVANSDQADNDNDGIGNVCDSTPDGDPIADQDSDGIADDVDNCPAIANVDQADNDNDGIGNVCDATPDGDVQCVEHTSSNYAHVSAGRATNQLGYAVAVGSGDNLGLYNLFVTSTVAETSSGYYQLGSCPAQ